MDRITLKELNMSTRKEVIAFLKKLWNEEGTACPVCGSELVLLHKKAKKNNCDWQCKGCKKIYRTMHLLDELNLQMPD